MSIQGSLNSIIGTVAGAAVAAEHAAEKKAIKEEQSALAKEQYSEAKSELSKLESQGASVDAKLEETTAAYDKAMAKRPGGKGNTKAAIAEKQRQALSEKEAAQRAFDELQDKIDAKIAMKTRAELIMKRTSKWGGIR